MANTKFIQDFMIKIKKVPAGLAKENSDIRDYISWTFKNFNEAEEIRRIIKYLVNKNPEDLNIFSTKERKRAHDKFQSINQESIDLIAFVLVLSVATRFINLMNRVAGYSEGGWAVGDDEVMEELPIYFESYIEDNGLEYVVLDAWEELFEIIPEHANAYIKRFFNYETAEDYPKMIKLHSDSIT
jgi:hypothetical protein